MFRFLFHTLDKKKSGDFRGPSSLETRNKKDQKNVSNRRFYGSAGEGINP